MHRLLPIFFACLISCIHVTTKEKHKAQLKDTIPEVRLDSNYHGKDAFDWDWDWPSHKILLPKSLTKYIAKGQEAIDTCTGDINEDNITDLILVTGVIKEDSLRYESSIALPRHLLVFLGRNNNQFSFSFRNVNVVPCINCCGMTDPYNGIQIKRGQIIINEYCASNWKSISEYRFRYNSKFKDWLLDTVVTESYAFNHDYYELDTTTKKDFGRVSLKTYVMYNDD